MRTMRTMHAAAADDCGVKIKKIPYFCGNATVYHSLTCEAYVEGIYSTIENGCMSTPCIRCLICMYLRLSTVP